MAADSPIRVLILDDERVIADVLSIILNQEGYVARATYTHDEALEAARELRPNIFITGMVNRTEKNGCETAAEIVDLLGKCYVLVISGSGYGLAVEAAEQYGKRGYAFTVCSKPLNPRDLLDLLKRAN